MTAAERDDPDVSPVIRGQTVNPDKFGPAQISVLRDLARNPETERVFVNPAIKKYLCRTVRGDRDWLQRIRPWWGHAAHFHLRLRCTAGDNSCEPGPPIPAGDGCGTELAWWFSQAASAPAEIPDAPGQRSRIMPSMPAACRAILTE